MIRITFIDHAGTRRVVEASPQQTLMQTAVQNGVHGILAECGGACVCGTCHCFLDDAGRKVTGEPGADERTLVEFSEHHRPGSRLSCQIQVTAAMDGLVVHLPPSQP